MHRKAGVKSIVDKRKQKDQFQKVGDSLRNDQAAQLKNTCSQFKVKLQEFAMQHASNLKSNILLRSQFLQMCYQLGVDPLTSNKTFWNQLTGLNDFYYILSIQIIQISLTTKQSNGGLIELGELKQKLVQLRGSNAQEITDDDIKQSVKSLKILGDGYEILTLGSRVFLQSVSDGMNLDFTQVLELADVFS